jgi:hypothetical protein
MQNNYLSSAENSISAKHGGEVPLTQLLRKIPLLFGKIQFNFCACISMTNLVRFIQHMPHCSFAPHLSYPLSVSNVDSLNAPLLRDISPALNDGIL